VLVPTILALLIAAAANIMLTSNLALADWKASFQQKPQIVTQSALSGTATIKGYVNKIGSGSSSSSIYASSTAKDPYERISSNNINPPQPFGTIHDGSPLVSRTNTNNADASAYATTTTGNTGSTPTTPTIQSMTLTDEPSHTQRQQQNPTLPEVVTSPRPSQVTMVTLSLRGQITCKPTEVLRNSNCSPQPPTCVSIGISQDSKCSTRPLYYHHVFESIRSFWHR
jgi:hypothetical protein